MVTKVQLLQEGMQHNEVNKERPQGNKFSKLIAVK
jgi:hypothetical protein